MKGWIITAAIMLTLLLAMPQPLRLHVLANSDSEADQSAKLDVRDAVLYAAKDKLSSASTRTDARRALMESSDELLLAAETALREDGMNYGASLELGWTEFPDKQYGDVIYPAGSYEALNIRLGNGDGTNWWCVMYPPLCIGDMEPDEPVQFKSAIAEFFRGEK